MAPFSVIIFGVVVWTTAVSGEKKLRFRLKTNRKSDGNGLVWTGPKKTTLGPLGQCPVEYLDWTGLAE